MAYEFSSCSIGIGISVSSWPWVVLCRTFTTLSCDKSNIRVDNEDIVQ